MEESNISVYTGKIKEAIEAIPPELYELQEETLRAKVEPSYKLYAVRRSFWEELLSAQDQQRSMVAARIYDGHFTRGYFYSSILTNHEAMAWITSPIVSYENKTKAALDRVTERYDELINMDIKSTKRIKTGEKDGAGKEIYQIVTETDPKKAMVLLNVIKNLEDRIKGTAIQRQVNISANKPSDAGGETSTLDMDTVVKKIEELEKQFNPNIKEEDDDREQDDGDQESETGALQEVCEDIDAESRRIETVDR